MTQSRTILVTGAASGIGAAICRVLAGPGAAIMVHTRRNRAGAEAVAEQVRAMGGKAAILRADLAGLPAAVSPIIEPAAGTPATSASRIAALPPMALTCSATASAPARLRRV